MRNDGKALESLVQSIEKALSHENVVVKCNPKEYADNGVQLAEFDVVVEGRIGSSDVRILLECRDRPSDGAAPGAWIDQMVGRRSTYNFSRVVAVSTTGFSPGAVLSAERNNIELRVIEKTDAESIRSWFFPGKILLRQVKADSLDVKIFPRQPLTAPLEAALKKLITGPKKATKIVFVRQAKSRLSVTQIWQEHSRMAFGDAGTWDLSKTFHLRVLCPKEEFDARILTPSGLIFVDRLEYTAKCSMHEEPVDLSVERYHTLGAESPLSETLKFQLPIPEGHLAIDLHKIPKVDGSAALFASTRLIPANLRNGRDNLRLNG